MNTDNPEFVHSYVNKMAGHSRRQMPVFSQVGKGIPGNAFVVELQQSGIDVNLVGKTYDQLNEEYIEEWNISLSDFVPSLHYELWTGVRTIDEVLCYVYWYNIKASRIVEDDEVILWEFVTPYVKRYEFAGGEPPADTMIDNA